MTEILMQNDTENALTIAGRIQLEQVVKYEINTGYQAHIDTISATPINVHCSVL